MKVATRESPLAVIQTEEALQAIKHLFPASTMFETIPVTTPGDRDLKTDLTDKAIPTDFFSRDLDRMILDGDASLAIHSAKDLPTPLPEGLTIAALLPARDIRDALVIREGLTTEDVHVIGTSSLKRVEEIRKLYPEAELKPIRGTIQGRLEQLDQGAFDAVIIAACALERLGLESRISSYLQYDPTPQQGRLALVCRGDNRDLVRILRDIDVRETSGMVVLMGVPADTALIPELARRYLKHADIILHDRLIPDEILQTISDRAVPVGKAGGHASTSQSNIHHMLLHEAEKGKLVVRLQGGDPGIYGHLSEQLDFLTSWNIRTDIVPSVTAAQVAAAKGSAPLTHRGEGHHLTLMSGRPPLDQPVPPFPGPEIGNLALYMGVGDITLLRDKFKEAGWQDASSVIVGERLGCRDECITHTTLGDLDTIQPESPAVFLVGTHSYPSRKATLFTGTDPDHFLKYGPVIHWPLIKLIALPREDRIRSLREHLDNVRGVIFPSRFAVQAFTDALMHIGDVRLLGGKLLLAVGPATRDEMHAAGMKADAYADNLGGVESLSGELTAGHAGRYLYPCSDKSPRTERIEALRAHDIDLCPVTFYRNRPIPFRDLPRAAFDRVIFTSTSTVNNYFERYPAEITADRTWIAVGPSTRKAIEQKGLTARML